MVKGDAFFDWLLIDGISAMSPSRPNISMKRVLPLRMPMIDELKNIA
jgi:hypothetical protein